MLIEYESGVRGIVDVRWHSKIIRDECRIRGTDGEIEMSPLNGPDLVWPAGRENLPAHPNLHYPMIENFVDAIEGKNDLQASGATSYRTDWVTQQKWAESHIAQPLAAPREAKRAHVPKLPTNCKLFPKKIIISRLITHEMYNAGPDKALSR